MPNESEQDPQRAEKLREAHERMVHDAQVMVRYLGTRDTAGVVLAAVLVVLQEAMGREAAHALLVEVVAALKYDGPPPGAERN